MDRTVVMSGEFIARIRGFLNSICQRCESCFRPKPGSCWACDDINRARALIVELDAARDVEEETYFIENPMQERYARVCKAIESAGCPLRSEEIRLDGVSKPLKIWTLKRMCKQRILGSKIDDANRYVFFIDKGMRFFNRTKPKNKQH